MPRHAEHGTAATASTPLLAGQRVVVAGGTGNVGRYMVRAFLDEGARVVVPSRSAERLEGLRAALGSAAGDRLITLVGDLGDEARAGRLQQDLKIHGPFHGAAASLGRFIPAPTVLAAPPVDLGAALNDYVVAHFMAVRALLPLTQPGGSYTFINGPLAFETMFEGAGLVSIATAAQAMLARVLFKENRDGPVRLNEVVVYTPFGWDDAGPAGALPREDVARYVARLASRQGSAIRNRTIHLTSRQPLDALETSPRAE